MVKEPVNFLELTPNYLFLETSTRTGLWNTTSFSPLSQTEKRVFMCSDFFFLFFFPVAFGLLLGFA